MIAGNADIVIAFWDGISKGTKFTVDYARKIGKPVKAVYTGGGLIPGNYGKDCVCNGEHYLCGELIACFCAGCDYARCCDDANYPQSCINCRNECCERKQLM